MVQKSPGSSLQDLAAIGARCQVPWRRAFTTQVTVPVCVATRHRPRRQVIVPAGGPPEWRYVLFNRAGEDQNTRFPDEPFRLIRESRVSGRFTSQFLCIAVPSHTSLQRNAGVVFVKAKSVKPFAAMSCVLGLFRARRFLCRDLQGGSQYPSDRAGSRDPVDHAFPG